MNNNWLQHAAASNRFKQTYLQGFLDVSGNTIVRNGSLSVKNGNVLIPHGDISMNGNIICSGSIELGATAGSGYKMVINGNTRVKNSLTVDNDASVMSSLGVGKAANDSYPLDVSGAARLSSDLTVGGSATIGSITTGSSRFNGNVGIGADVDPNYALYTNGQFRSTGLSTFDQAIAVGSGIDVEAGELQSSTLFVKVPITSTATNDVIMNVPNNLYTSTDDANHAQVNNLEIDTKNRVIKPYRNYEGALVTDAVNGWDLGAPGAYSFDHVYGRSLEVSKNVGIGKSSDAAYAMDVSGASRLSSNLTVGGAATVASITDVTGTSKFSGHVGFGKVASGTHAVDVSGSTRVSGVAFVDTSVVIGQSEPSTAALHVKVPYNLDVSNSVVFEVPNVIYKSTSSENPSQTNYLEIDTKTRSIKPYAKAGDTLLNSAETGWDLGGPGANRFNTIYGRDLQISTNTIKIEDDSGNQISMGFDAKTGAVNYTVTTISGEVFLIKGVQTQKISSGAGTIDPSMLEFTGLSFGDTFVTNDVYSLDSAFTYNLGTTTYTGNGTDFSTNSAAQSLNSFVTGTNLTTLLARITSGDSVVIKVGDTDGRTAHLEGIDVEGSLVSLSNKIISVHKQGATIKWTLWNSDAYQSSAGNFLHYIELKNINMASGTYFVAKTAGTLTYNINDTHFMSSGDLAPVNGDLYLYIERGPGNNWTKIPVSLPQSGSIQTQHLADSAVTTSKLANNSVTGDKLAGGSISGTKITDNSITGAKIADSNVTNAKIADGAITGAKIADGAINSATLIANGIITGAKLVAGSVTESILGDSSVVTVKLADNSISTEKIADSAVTADKVLDGTLTSGKFATDSITSIKIVGGAVTNAKIADNSISNEKIMDGAITASKLAAGVVTGNLLDASSVTMDKIATGAISTEKIAGLSVTSTKIAALAVTSAKLADGAVTDAKLATDSVISEKIAASAVTAAKIATGAVTTDKVADGAIIGTKIAAGAITGNHFNTSAVTADKIASMAVTTAKLNDFAVTTIKIGNLAVGTEQINDASVTGAKIASGAITTALLDASAVTMDNIATGAITTEKIASGSISVSKIASGAVTTAKIASGAITAALLDASAVTVDKIATGSVTTSKLADSSVTTAKLNANSVTTSAIADGSITAAKLAAGFTLPSGAGGGTSITSTSDVLAQSYATAKASTPVGYISIKFAQDVNTSTLPPHPSSPYIYFLGNECNSAKISGDGNVAVVSTMGIWGDSGFLAIFRKNSSGKFVYSEVYNGYGDGFNNFNGIRPTITDINYDGSRIIYINQPNLSDTTDNRKYKTYLFGVIKYANSAWTNVLIPTHGTYGLRGIQFSGDYSKIVICYTICNNWDWVTSTGIHGILIYDSTTYTLLKNINTTAISNITVVQDNSSYRITPFGVSDTGSRIIYGTPGFNNLFGKVTIYETTFNSVSSTYSAVASSPAPSYAPVGYLPIPLENLPSRFKLKLANGIYVGQAWYLSVSNYAILPAVPHCVFEADKPSDLYSTIGTNTYRLTENTFARSDNNKRLVKSYLDSSIMAMQESIDNTSYKAAWQLFLKTGTTTNEVVIWTPSTGSASGKFITTYNGGAPSYTGGATTSGTTFGLGTGTPIVFYLEPESLSDLNPTTIVGEMTGTEASGANSRVGGAVAISSNGNTIAYTSSNLNDNSSLSNIKIYNFVSNNNWSLKKTIINSEIQGSSIPSSWSFGNGLKINKNGNVLIINSVSHMATYVLSNGVWMLSDYYSSGLGLSIPLTLSNDGGTGIISGRFSGVDKIYVFDLVSTDISAKSIATNYLISNISSAMTGYLKINGTDTLSSFYMPSVSATTVSATTVSATTVSATTVSATTVSATSSVLSNLLITSNINSKTIRNNVNPTLLSMSAKIDIFDSTPSYRNTYQHLTGFGLNSDCTRLVWLDWNIKNLYFAKKNTNGTWVITNNNTPFTGSSYDGKFLPIMSGNGKYAATFGGWSAGGDDYSNNYTVYSVNESTGDWNGIGNPWFSGGYPRNAKLSYDGSRLLMITNNNSIGSRSINASINIFNTNGNAPIYSLNVGSVFGIDIDNDVYNYDLGYYTGNVSKNRFGCSDDLSRVIISAAKNSAVSGRAIVLDLNTSTNGAYNKIFDVTVNGERYGINCEMSGDGQIIAIAKGDPNATSSSVMIYKYNSTLTTTDKYTLVQTITQSNSNITTAGFGTVMKFNHDDSSTLMINARYAAVVYRATNSDRTTWALLHNLTGGNFFIGLSGNGNSYLMQNPNTFANLQGSIELYERTETDFNTKSGYIAGNLITDGSITTTGISVTGNVSVTGTVTSNSDDRLKEEEELIINATDTLLKLRPENYMKKNTFESTDSTKWKKESGVIAQEVWYSAPELRHLVTLGYDISGNYEYQEADTESATTASLLINDENPVPNNFVLSMDISGNHYITYLTDLSGNSEQPIRIPITDASYSDFELQLYPVNQVKIPELVPVNIKTVKKPIYVPINPVNIKDYTPTSDIQNDPDYAALGWGDTPASVNYIGLIPYLIKSIQELNTKIIEQETTISELKSKI